MYSGVCVLVFLVSTFVQPTNYMNLSIPHTGEHSMASPPLSIFHVVVLVILVVLVVLVIVVPNL